MAIEMHPIYNEYFFAGGNSPFNWSLFKTQPDSQDAIVPVRVDFSVQNSPRTCWEIVRVIALLILKIVIFPWGIYEGVQYITGRIVMAFVYPAQTKFSVEHLDGLRQGILQANQEAHRIYRHVVLEKNGICYSGLIFGTADTISSRKWVIQAVGNYAVIEEVSPLIIEALHQTGYNVLLVNGPGVGRSEGPATPDSLGDAQEVGIAFVETAMKAQNIILMGHSLGAGAMSRAILQHEFRQGINYFVILTMTFDKLSHIVEKIVGPVGRKLIHWLDYEMDSLAASRKLQDLQIRQIVIKGGMDPLMQGVDLVERLQGRPASNFTNLYILSTATHNDFPLSFIKDRILEWDQQVNLPPLMVDAV